MKKNLISTFVHKRMLWVILTLLWMLIIFLFSAKTADESGQQSMAIGMKLCDILYDDFEEWSEEIQYQTAEFFEKPIRKSAHLAEYAVLGFLLVGAWAKPEFSRRKVFWLAWFCAVAYACTDEIHQLFVPGRYGSVVDVAIDSAGALIGAWVSRWMRGLCGRKGEM